MICFDKSDAFDLSNISIPFVQQPIAEMGKHAVDVLVQQMTQKDITMIHHELEANLEY